MEVQGEDTTYIENLVFFSEQGLQLHALMNGLTACAVMYAMMYSSIIV